MRLCAAMTAGLCVSAGAAPRAATALDSPARDGARLAAWLRECPSLAQCAEPAEREALADARWRAHREGDLLRVGAPDKALRWMDGPGQPHRLLGEVGQTGLGLVVAPVGDRHQFWVFDPTEGRRWPLPGLPWPAPDGRLLAVAFGSAGGDPAEPGGVHLWLRVGSRWTQTLVFEAPGLQVEGRGWRPDGAAVRLQWARGPAAARCTGPLQLRDGPYGWELVPAPPARCP